MMNFVALFLVVSSLFSAGVWPPSASPPNGQTQQQKQRQDDHQQQPARDQEVIVKNGHRVVVVEYDEHGHPNTKVSIVSEHHPPRKDSSSFSDNEVLSPSKISRAFDNAMENIKEAASALPNFGQHGEGHSPKELMCDVYGKCKHKLASAIETKKQICRETAHGAKELCKETAHEAREAAHKVGEAAHRVGDAVENVYERAKETVSDKAHNVEETARDTMGKAKNATKDLGDTLAGDIQRNVSIQRERLAEKAKEAKEAAEETAGKVKAGAEELKSRIQKRLHQLGDKGREFWYGAFRSIASSDLLEGLMSVAHLFGLATAYGMCTWITFGASHVLSGSLQAQQFGMVQGKIYKIYFKAMAYSVGMAFASCIYCMFVGF